MEPFKVNHSRKNKWITAFKQFHDSKMTQILRNKLNLLKWDIIDENIMQCERIKLSKSIINERVSVIKSIITCERIHEIKINQRM